MPLFHAAGGRALDKADPASSSPSRSAASILAEAEKENDRPLTVLFSPARIDQRAKDAVRVNEAAITARIAQRRSHQSKADEEGEEDEEQPGSVAVSAALQSMSLSTRAASSSGRKRRHGEAEQRAVVGEVGAVMETKAAVATELTVAAGRGHALRQSKRTRQGRGRGSGEAEVSATVP